jgi:hypothetical protein
MKLYVEEGRKSFVKESKNYLRGSWCAIVAPII